MKKYLIVLRVLWKVSIPSAIIETPSEEVCEEQGLEEEDYEAWMLEEAKKHILGFTQKFPEFAKASFATYWISQEDGIAQSSTEGPSWDNKLREFQQ